MLSSLRSWREHLTPVSTANDFKETGQLSPEAFVLAGDYLVDKFPAWSWQSGDKSTMRDFLPPAKQYLLLKSVACTARADSLENDLQEDTEDGFVNTYSSNVQTDIGEIPDIDGQAQSVARTAKLDKVHAQTPNEDLPDLDQLALPDDDEDPDTLLSSNTVSSRTYDIYMTYDKYYRTPRVWLFGWSEAGSPLSASEVWQDISGDHAGKTVTMEAFPHSASGSQMASVHPCKHSAVMKTFIARADQQAILQAKKNPNKTDQADGVRVDQYLIIFLLFIATITPTIEHDTGFYI